MDGPINIRSDLMSHGMVGGRHVGGIDSDTPNTLIYLVCPTELTFIGSLSLELQYDPVRVPAVRRSHVNDDMLHWEVGWVQIKFSLQ
jgi:hypothetical protein